VALAVERGLVKVRVNHKVASCLELAIALRQRHSLVLCEVVPVNADSIDQVLRKIAVAGAPVMESYLNDIKPKIIALSSGQTIKAVTRVQSGIISAGRLAGQVNSSAYAARRG
jgi:DNA-binding transcriptional regulator LsrR (DeoR family)